jgi:uncharacterized integral membrane protein
MSKTVACWRLRLFRSGLVLAAIEFGLYLCGVACVRVIEPVDAKLRAAAWLFVIGLGLSLIALILSMFGSGWKRLGLAVMCVLSLSFWYGLTLY